MQKIEIYINGLHYKVYKLPLTKKDKKYISKLYLKGIIK